MKYLKTFEDIHPLLYDIHDIQYDTLKLLIGKWLDKIKPENYSVDYSWFNRGNKIPSIALNGSLGTRKSSYPVFTIGFTGVKDKKQRENSKIIKQKVHLDFTYDINSQSDANIDFVNTLRGFLVDIFKRYSYFDKKKDYYWNRNLEMYDYYILTEDIPNIMKDLENDFEIYSDAKKYNL